MRALEVRVLVPALSTEGVEDFQRSPHERFGFLDPAGVL